jgi:hypothetical protein
MLEARSLRDRREGAWGHSFLRRTWCKPSPNSLEMSRPASQASVSAILGVASRAAPSSCQAPLCGKHLPKSTEDFSLG